MSRAAIVLLLTRALHRTPTRDEYEDCRKLALQLCPSGRLYIPGEPKQEPLLCDIVDWHRNGWSVRKIARKLGVSKSRVHRALSQNSVATVDTDPPNV